MHQPGTLYIVSTPIGNLEDITLRALNILKSVDIIACEDTRHSLKLLNHYEIKNRLISYHSHNEKNSSSGIVKLLKDGKNVALISDGGTPLISDPGYSVVGECRMEGITVTAIPGATALIPLLCMSGFRTDSFFFAGFLSCKGGKRRKDLEAYKSIEASLIFYESPHRIEKFVADIAAIYPDKQICIGKEISKINEKTYIGTPEEAQKQLSADKIAGEYAVIIANY